MTTSLGTACPGLRSGARAPPGAGAFGGVDDIMKTTIQHIQHFLSVAARRCRCAAPAGRRLARARQAIARYALIPVATGVIPHMKATALDNLVPDAGPAAPVQALSWVWCIELEDFAAQGENPCQDLDDAHPEFTVNKINYNRIAYYTKASDSEDVEGEIELGQRMPGLCGVNRLMDGYEKDTRCLWEWKVPSVTEIIFAGHTVYLAGTMTVEK